MKRNVLKTLLALALVSLGCMNVAAQNQATDRVHRIGQTKQVTVYKLILKDTIEERIVALQDAKRDLAEAILEGQRESILSLSNEELLALLN